jgi:hypothetical protein
MKGIYCSPELLAAAAFTKAINQLNMVQTDLMLVGFRLKMHSFHGGKLVSCGLNG